MELRTEPAPSGAGLHPGGIDDPSGKSSSGASLLRARLHELTLLPGLAVVFVVGAFVNDAFLTSTNLIDSILQGSSALAVLVIAESLILIAGRFDLSLESTVVLAPMFAAWLMVPAAVGGSGAEIPPFLGLLVLAGVGAVIGVVNGFFVVKLKLNAFMVTLAMLILLRGISLGVTNGQTLVGLPDAFLYLGSARALGVPMSVWVTGVLFVAAGLFLRYHSIGRGIYAIGGNQEAARAAGIRVERTIWGLFIVGGVLAALAGLMLTGWIASVTPNQGQNLIFSVFAAAVIGGVSLKGGAGTMFGAFTGVLLLGTITNILTLSKIQSFWIDASYGAIILGALVLSRFTTGAKEE